MKKYCWFGLVILIGAFYAGIDVNADNTGASAGSGQKDTATITLAAGGKSDYAIVVPNGDDPQGRVKKASDLMQATLAEATGAKLPVVKEGELKAGTPAIYLGRTRAAEQAGLPLKQLKGWAFLKQVKGKDVFLVGIDDTAGIKDAPHIQYLGTLKAVTSFLEDEVGVRFVMPGPNGIYVPKIEKLAIKDNLKVLTMPEFLYVITRPSGEVYSVANNYVATGILKSYGGHSYYDAVPKDKYAKDHPEYFALIGGVRSSENNHLCISNPEVQELMLKEMVKQLDKGFEWVELAQTDGYVPCDCDKCRAIHPDIGERLWIVHRLLAKRLKKERPGKKAMIISYGPTAMHPPTSFDKFPDNVVIQMCNYSSEAFDEWRPFNLEKTVYLYNWGTYQITGIGPKRTPRYAGEQVRRLVDNGVCGVYLCGSFENLGLEGPVFYVFGKMMGNPKLNYEDLVNDYYRAAFGKARAPMRAFFSAMNDRLEMLSVFYRPNFRTEMKYMPPFTSEDWYCLLFPAKLLIDMEKNLERAKALADEPAVQARIRRVEIEFSYVKNLANIFQMYRVYRLKPSWETFNLLAEELERRNTLIDSWYDEKGAFMQMLKQDGFGLLCNGLPKEHILSGGRMWGTLGAPVAWNTKLLKEKKVLPGVSSKTAKVARVKGISLDGKLDDPAWQGIPAEELGEVSMGEVKNKTTFKMGYDEENIYFGFECAFDNPERIEINPFGRDAACYNSECLEIFLDPFGGREKYCHFVFNPVANSFYDARRGFIDDPLNPLYNKEDKSWNGAWEYRTVIDKDKKVWTAEVKIPFKTLETATPKSGTTWTMNLGREEFPSKEKLYLSLWSPNLEEGNFCAPAAFGSLVFE